MAIVVMVFILLAQFWFQYVTYVTDENGIERIMKTPDEKL